MIYFSMQLVELEALLLYQMCLDLASTDKYRDYYLTFRRNGIHGNYLFEVASGVHLNYCEHLSKFCLKQYLLDEGNTFYCLATLSLFHLDPDPGGLWGSLL